MADIVCKLKDYSMLYIDCEPGLASELSEYFSFYVPGFKFMPAYKRKIWDGKIKLFNRLTGELNAGLYVYLIKFCAERNYILDTEETDYGLPFVDNNIDDWSLFLQEAALPFMPRDYQSEAVLKGLRRRRGILLSPTGSGKSFIAYLLVKYFLKQEENKVLIIVPTTSLVEQMYSDFEEYGMDVSKDIHRIYSGQDKDTQKRIIVSTWQSIYKLPPIWFKQFGMVIGDECHGFKSKSLSSIMNKSTEAEYRFGLTGTLDGTLTHKLVLEGLFGPVYKVTTTKALQDNKTLAELNIKIAMLRYSEEVRKEWWSSPKTYQDEIEFIINHEKRNKFIQNLSLSLEGNSLVLYNRVDTHGRPLFDMIYNSVSDGRKVFFVSGQVETSDREAIRKIVEKQKNAIIVASLGTFSTGINIRNLHNIIFASPSKSQIKVLQSIGRGLRQSDDGRTTHLYDIADDLSHGKRNNYTLMHSVERVRIYDTEQFKYKMVKVDM